MRAEQQRGRLGEGVPTVTEPIILSVNCPSGDFSFVVKLEGSFQPAITRNIMQTKTSPYLLIFRDVSHDVYSTISAQERQELMQQWNAWYDGLAAQG